MSTKTIFRKRTVTRIALAVITLVVIAAVVVEIDSRPKFQESVDGWVKVIHSDYSYVLYYEGNNTYVYPDNRKEILYLPEAFSWSYDSYTKYRCKPRIIIGTTHPPRFIRCEDSPLRVVASDLTDLGDHENMLADLRIKTYEHWPFLRGK